MSVTITVHRGTQQIGGSCIEIKSSTGQRLILDVGRPLDAGREAVNLLPVSLDKSELATVIISHSHQDHWGLINELPASWRIFASEGTATLIRITSQFMRTKLRDDLETWSRNCKNFTVEPFLIRPILTDHSAFDAQMLLIEIEGRRILYSGDFRKHGRKSSLVDALIRNPPPNIDVLIIEGTNLGSDKPVVHEWELEESFVSLFKTTTGRVFVSWSAQNIDRTVTLYRAAKRTGRTLAIDLYTADVLDRISAGTRLPRAGFPNLEVVITRAMAAFYKKSGRDEFIQRMLPNAISAKKLVEGRHVIMLRRSLMNDFKRAGVCPTPNDSYNFSMWKGYISENDFSAPLKWCEDGGARIEYLHTSGHASEADLRALARAVAAKHVIPVHGSTWDENSSGFDSLVRLADGEEMVLQ